VNWPVDVAACDCSIRSKQLNKRL